MKMSRLAPPRIKTRPRATGTATSEPATWGNRRTSTPSSCRASIISVAACKPRERAGRRSSSNSSSSCVLGWRRCRPLRASIPIMWWWLLRWLRIGRFMMKIGSRWWIRAGSACTLTRCRTWHSSPSIKPSTPIDSSTTASPASTTPLPPEPAKHSTSPNPWPTKQPESTKKSQRTPWIKQSMMQGKRRRTSWKWAKTFQGSYQPWSRHQCSSRTN